jgi:hypothetical protein
MKELQPTRLPPQPKKSKKSLAMPPGIVTNGVILQVLGGTMRKFKTCSSRSLPFRLFVIVAGALLLLAAFAPCANADLLRFYDFEGTPTAPYPVNLDSHQPAAEQGPGTTLILESTTTGVPYPVANTTANTGIPLNVPPGALPNTTSLGIHRSGVTNLNIIMTFTSPTGVYNIQSVSFASAGSGNGFQNVQLQFSSNGGATWTNLSAVTPIPTAITTIVLNNTLCPGCTLGVPNLLVRLNFINGQSNGGDLQNVIDNIQVNGTIVPEPATVAGGLLGVLALCWHQRRRLIRSLRFRRASG